METFHPLSSAALSIWHNDDDFLTFVYIVGAKFKFLPHCIISRTKQVSKSALKRKMCNVCHLSYKSSFAYRVATETHIQTEWPYQRKSTGSHLSTALKKLCAPLVIFSSVFHFDKLLSALFAFPAYVCLWGLHGRWLLKVLCLHCRII